MVLWREHLQGKRNRKERREHLQRKRKERKRREHLQRKRKERKEHFQRKRKRKEGKKAKERAREVEHTFQEIATNADFPDTEQLTAGMQVPWKLVQSWIVKLMMIALGMRTAGIRRTGPKTMVRRTGQTRRTGHGTTAGLPALSLIHI